MKSKPKTIESYAIISKKAVFLFSILFFVLLKYCAVPSFSQSTITVVGRGATKEQALQDALRTAVERATGVFLYSVTDVKNYKVVQDKIVTQSKGYVKDYQIVEQKSFDGLIVLTVTVSVDVESIKTILRKDLKAVTYDDVLKDYMLVTQKMERLQKSAELLKAITSRPVEEMYSFDYVGYEITDVGLKSAEGNFFIRISLNPFFWDTYEKILEVVSDEGGKAIACGLFKDSGIRNKSGRKYLGGDETIKLSAPTYFLHPDLLDYTLQVREFSLKLRIQGRGVIQAINKTYYYKNLKGWVSQNLTEKYLSTHSKKECEWIGETTDSPLNSNFDSYINRLAEQQKDVSVIRTESAGAFYFFKNAITFKEPFKIQDPEIVKEFNKISISVE